MSAIHCITPLEGLNNPATNEPLLWVPPHMQPTLGFETDYYENPYAFGGLTEILPCDPYIQSAKLTGLKCRVLGNYYIRKPSDNGVFDYYEIDVSGWGSTFDPINSKARNSFKKTKSKALERPLKLVELSIQDWLDNLPLVHYLDSAATFAVPALTNHPELGFIPTGYYYGDRLVALCLYKIVVCGDFSVLAHPTLIRIDTTFTASEITYWLCDFAHAEGVHYVDIWNIALSSRETYKQAFFTGTRKAFCFYQGVEKPWLHRI